MSHPITRTILSCGRALWQRPAVQVLLKYGLGLGVLAWLLWNYWSPADGSRGLSDALQQQFHVTPLLLALACTLAVVLLTFARWYVLVRAQDLPFTLTDAVRLGFVDYFLNTFLPGSIGGDVIKAAFIARQQDRRTVAVATVLIDRVVGLCGLIWLVSLLGGAFWAGGWLTELTTTPAAVAALETIVAGACLLTLGTVVFWCLLGFLPTRRADIFAGRLTKIPKIGGSLAELWRAIWMYRCRGRHVALAMLLALVGHCGIVVTLYFAALTVFPADAIPSLGAQCLITPVGITIQAGFPAPGGMGGGEYAFGKLYEMVGFAVATGVLVVLVQRLVQCTLGVVGYLIYLRTKPGLQTCRQKVLTPPDRAVAKAG